MRLRTPAPERFRPLARASSLQIARWVTSRPKGNFDNSSLPRGLQRSGQKAGLLALNLDEQPIGPSPLKVQRSTQGTEGIPPTGEIPPETSAFPELGAVFPWPYSRIAVCHEIHRVPTVLQSPGLQGPNLRQEKRPPGEHWLLELCICRGIPLARSSALNTC